MAGKLKNKQAGRQADRETERKEGGQRDREAGR